MAVSNTGKWAKKIAAEAVVQGFTVRQTKAGWMIYSDNGHVLIHDSEDQHRSPGRTYSRLRRIGFDPDKLG